MVNKLTIEDFTKDESIEITDTKKPLILNNRDEINQFISTKEIRANLTQDKTNFYDVVPKTKLESCINKILNKNTESLEEKSKRLIFQQNYDTKMRRMKRIKSKAYRKTKRLARKEAECEEDFEKFEEKIIEKEDEEEIEIEEVENAPIFNFAGNVEKDNQNEVVQLAFENDMEENEEEFVKEKEDLINEDTPKVIETVLPGWGDWAGPGLEIVKTKFNTIVETKEGINYNQRKDFGSSHVIINEGSNEIDDKYKSKLPYGYSKEDYITKLSMPVSKECVTSRMYKKVLNKVVRPKSGEDIEPFKYEPENL